MRRSGNGKVTMAGMLVSFQKSVTFWMLFGLSTALALVTIAILGPSVELPPEVAGAPATAKATWKVLLQPATMLLIWFGFRYGARANQGGGVACASSGEADEDVLRASGQFTRTLITAALGYSVLLFVVQVISIGRLTGVEPLASLDGADIVRVFLVGAGVIEMFMGNAWPKSAPAAARAGDPMHAHRMSRFRGWWMTLNGLTVLICALTLPVKLAFAAFFVLWLIKVAALNVASSVYGGPRSGVAGS